jgi:hypothetical protein
VEVLLGGGVDPREELELHEKGSSKSTPVWRSLGGGPLSLSKARHPCMVVLRAWGGRVLKSEVPLYILDRKGPL